MSVFIGWLKDQFQLSVDLGILGRQAVGLSDHEGAGEGDEEFGQSEGLPSDEIWLGGGKTREVEQGLGSSREECKEETKDSWKQ